MGHREGRRRQPTTELQTLAARLKWRYVRRTKRQRLQYKHPTTGSVMTLPTHLYGRDIDNYRRLILRGAREQLCPVKRKAPNL